MKRFWILVFVIFLSGCGVDFEETPTTFLSSFPNDTIEVTSNDLSNKGLVCNVGSIDPIFENIGFWFVDDKRLEKNSSYKIIQTNEQLVLQQIKILSSNH